MYIGIIAAVTAILGLVAAVTGPEPFQGVHVGIAPGPLFRGMIDRVVLIAERAYGESALLQAERKAATLAKWIIKNRKERINSREHQRQVRLPGMRNAAEIREALEALIEADWLRHDPKRAGETKGKRSGDYEVNPATAP